MIELLQKHGIGWINRRARNPQSQWLVEKANMVFKQSFLCGKGKIQRRVFFGRKRFQQCCFKRTNNLTWVWIADRSFEVIFSTKTRGKHWVRTGNETMDCIEDESVFDANRSRDNEDQPNHEPQPVNMQYTFDFITILMTHLLSPNSTSNQSIWYLFKQQVCSLKEN